MRILALVFSLTMTLSLTALALTYVPAYVGQSRIVVQPREDSTPDHQSYHSYGSLANTTPPTSEATGLDPQHQRYYSESEGWTYYTLPAPADSSRALSSLPGSNR